MTDRNHIQIAASSESLFHARLLIKTCMRIEADEIADRILPDAADWKAMNYFRRIEAIADWLRAECFALVEQDEVEAA